MADEQNETAEFLHLDAKRRWSRLDDTSRLGRLLHANQSPQRGARFLRAVQRMAPAESYLEMRARRRVARESAGRRDVTPRVLTSGLPVEMEIPFPHPFPIEKAATQEKIESIIDGVAVNVQFVVTPRRSRPSMRIIMDAAAAALPTPSHGWVNIQVSLSAAETLTSDRCVLTFDPGGSMDEMQRRVDLLVAAGNEWAAALTDWACLCSNARPVDTVLQGQARLLGEVVDRGSRKYVWPSFTPEHTLVSYLATDVRPLNAADLAVLLSRVRTKQEVTTPWQLLRAAWTALANGEYRVAVIDSGGPTELAVHELYRRYQASHPEALPNISKRTLGPSITAYASLPEVSLPGGLTLDDVRTQLVEVRNAAAHRARATEAQTHVTVEVAATFVAAAFPLPVNPDVQFGPGEPTRSAQISARHPRGGSAVEEAPIVDPPR